MYVYNLVLTGVWLVFGVGLLIHNHVQPGNNMTFRLGATDISLGWVALVLAFYNVMRWWSRRASHQSKRQHAEIKQSRDQARRERLYRESGREPDPNFQFDDPS